VRDDIYVHATFHFIFNYFLRKSLQLVEFIIFSLSVVHHILLNKEKVKKIRDLERVRLTVIHFILTFLLSSYGYLYAGLTLSLLVDRLSSSLYLKQKRTKKNFGILSSKTTLHYSICLILHDNHNQMILSWNPYLISLDHKGVS